MEEKVYIIQWKIYLTSVIIQFTFESFSALLSRPLLRSKRHFQQINYWGFEGNGDAERTQVRGDEIAEVQYQLWKKRRNNTYIIVEMSICDIM